MNFMNELNDIAKEYGGIIQTKIAAERGISKNTLYKLCCKDKIERIAYGQYVLVNELEDEFLSISNRSTKIIFSHESALYLRGISDRTPFEHSVTVSSNNVPSKIIKNECKVYYIKQELFELGKTFLKTPAGNEVPVYEGASMRTVRT